MAWFMLGVLALLQVFASMGHFSYSPLVSFIQQDLHLSAAQVGGLPAAMFMGSVLCGGPIGWLVDRLGVKRSMLVGPLLFGGALSALYWVRSYPLLLTGIFLAGCTYAFVTPLLAKGLLGWFDQRWRGLAFGVTQAGVTIGVAMAAYILTRVAIHFGWGAAFLFSGMVIYLVWFIGWCLYRDPPLHSERVAVARRGLWSTLGSVGEPRLIAIYSLGLVHTGYQVAMTTFLVPYLHNVMGLGVVLAASLLGTSQVSGSFMRPLAGWVSDKLLGGKRKHTILFFSLIGAGSMLLLSLLPVNTPYWVIWLVVCITGSAFLAWAGLFFTLIAEVAGPASTGAATGMGSMFNGIGGATIPLLFGFLVDIGGYRTAMFVNSGGLILICLVLSTLSLERSRSEATDQWSA